MAVEINNLDYFNLSDGNSMGIEERIKQAFAVDGKVKLGGVVYKSEQELRDKLLQKGVIKQNENSTNEKGGEK